MLTIYKIGARFLKKITMNGTAQCLWMVQSMPFSFSFPSFLFFSDNLAWDPLNILRSLLQKCCILAGVITDTNSYHFEQKAVHINRRYLVPMLNLQCAQIKITPSVPFFLSYLFEKSNFLRKHHLLSCLPFKNV